MSKNQILIGKVKFKDHTTDFFKEFNIFKFNDLVNFHT